MMGVSARRSPHYLLHTVADATKCHARRTGRLGLYIVLALPIIDIGIAQNAMAAPPAWAIYVPGFGAVRVLLDAGFTAGFDEWMALIVAFGWLAAVTLAAVAQFHRLAEPRD